MSVTNIGLNWTPDHEPRNPEAAAAWRLAEQGIIHILKAKPRYLFIENPRAKMRRLMEIHFPQLERVTIAQCRYGKSRQKMTDIWGLFPKTWKPLRLCRNGDDCHESQPRGASPGKQGQGVEGARLPLPFSMEICKAVEKEML